MYTDIFPSHISSILLFTNNHNNNVVHHRRAPRRPMREWCCTGFDSAPHDPFWDTCANTTRGHERDFTTICCDGEIINTSVDIWVDPDVDYTTLELTDMVCCRQAGRNSGGLLPLPADYTHCASADPKPLASMAATNINNAQNIAATYVSASAGTADWTKRSTASCLWVNTKNVSSTTEVTLPAAVVTTLLLESEEVYWTGGAEDSQSDAAFTTPATNYTTRATGSSSSRSIRTSQAAAASTTPAENAALRARTIKWPGVFSVFFLLARTRLPTDTVV